MALNVNRNVADPFYRYKMPRLQAKVEGKGNGIKTVIANMSEIAKALNRPPTYPTKFFGCELGAQTQFDLKNERYIVNGEHDAGRLQEILDGFIQRFVLCPECDNPETKLRVKKGQIVRCCIACGNIGQVDQKHKLCTFIVKNPPPPEEPIVGTGAAVASTEEKNGKGSPVNGEADGSGDDEVGLEFNENVNGLDLPDSTEDKYDDWTPDTTETDGASKARLTGAMAALTMNADLEKSLEDRLDMFYEYVTDVKKRSDSGGSPLDGKAMLLEAERLDIKDKAALLLCRALFDADVMKQIASHRTLLLRFCNENTKAQKYLLGGMEQLLTMHKEQLFAKTPLVLKELYDQDIVDEEVFMDWGKKPSSKYVEKKNSKEILKLAEPFLTWLSAAEEETDEEDDEEILFTSNVAEPVKIKAAGTATKTATVPTSNGAAVHADDDDFDIENI